MKVNKSGFSLIELSIVLIIVGFLVVAVISGNSLVQSAKINSIITNVNDLKTAFFTFSSIYNRLPGDIDDDKVVGVEYGNSILNPYLIKKSPISFLTSASSISQAASRGDTTECKDYVTAAVQVVKDSGLNCQLTGMGTQIEAKNLKELYEVIAKAQEAVFEVGVGRVYTVIKVDDRRDLENRTLEAKIKTVENMLD